MHPPPLNRESKYLYPDTTKLIKYVLYLNSSMLTIAIKYIMPKNGIISTYNNGIKSTYNSSEISIH